MTAINRTPEARARSAESARRHAVLQRPDVKVRAGSPEAAKKRARTREAAQLQAFGHTAVSSSMANTQRRFDVLDQLSRMRALTDPESLELERLIGALDA
jgi:hypothetical protein